MKSYSLTSVVNSTLYNLQLNLVDYLNFRGELLSKIKKGIKTQHILCLKEVYYCNNKSIENNSTITQTLLFLSDILSLTNKYPNYVLIENKAFKLTSISNKELYKQISRILSLIGLKEKADIISDDEGIVDDTRQQDFPEQYEPTINNSFINAEYELMKAGLRRAGKYECNSRKEAEAINKVMRKTFPYTKITKNKQNQIDIYYSLNKEYLDDIINSDNVLTDEYIRKSGWLFGYPKCCTKEYLKSGFQYLPPFPYKWLIRRYQTSGEINPLFNPFLSNLYYFPCNLRCEPTLKRLKIISKHIISKDKMKLLYIPIVFFLPPSINPPTVRGSIGNMEYVIIEPTILRSDTIKYKFVEYSTRTQKTEIIKKGDLLTISDGVMTVSKGNKIIHRFFLEANIWFYKKTFDKAFWNMFIKVLLNAVKYKPITIKRELFSEDFITIKNCLQKGRIFLSNHNIFIEKIDLCNDEIIIDLNFATRNKLTLSIQNLKATSKYYMKGRKYALSIKRLDNLSNNVLFSLCALILNLIEGNIP